MRILVIGGTLFFGIDLVKQLLEDGHDVTLATRGNNDDVFAGQVEFIRFDRHDVDNIDIRGRYFDVVIDKIACSSNDMRNFFEHIECDKYILMSTAGVYKEQHLMLKETDFNPTTEKLIWLNRADTDYHEAKRQTEIALFQEYIKYNPIAVRYPVVFGEKDYTRRLEFFVRCIKNDIPMFVNNMDVQMPFISSQDAGKFMSTLVYSDYVGAVNGASVDTISIRQIISYIELKTHKKAVFSVDGEQSALNNTLEYSLDTSIACKLGYQFKKVNDWMPQLIDYYIQTV